jgi:hypothetical protein
MTGKRSQTDHFQGPGWEFGWPCHARTPANAGVWDLCREPGQLLEQTASGRYEITLFRMEISLKALAETNIRPAEAQLAKYQSKLKATQAKIARIKHELAATRFIEMQMRMEPFLLSLNLTLYCS